MKDLLIRITLLTVSTVFCFIILELVGRQSLSFVARNSLGQLGGTLESNPELLIEYTPQGRRMIPNADVVIHNHYVSGLDVDVKTNSLGLRDSERKPQPDPGTERILFLGDSIIAQDYLPTQMTLPVLVENKLNSLGTKKYEVINTGLSNAGLEEELQILSEVIDRLHPTMVLLSFYLNDSRPAWGYSGEMGAQRGWFRKHSVVIETIMRELEVRKWLKGSKVERFGWINLADTTPWKSDPNAFQKLVDNAPFDWGSAWDRKSWGEVEKNLVKLQQLVINKGATLRVISMPVIYQVEADFIEDTPQRELAEILKKHNIPFLNPLEMLREHRSQTLYYDWCHPNLEGNQLLAQSLSTFLNK